MKTKLPPLGYPERDVALMDPTKRPNASKFRFHFFKMEHDMKPLSFLIVSLSAVLTAGIPISACAEISIGVLTKNKAKEKYGITMHARKNGDAGIKVWLEFKKEGWLEKFTYAELRMTDEDGKHLLSAKLEPNAVHHRQSPDITTVYFSANRDQLENCSFLVVCYGSNEGDVGYYLNLKDFLDLENPVTEE